MYQFFAVYQTVYFEVLPQPASCHNSNLEQKLCLSHAWHNPLVCEKFHETRIDRAVIEREYARHFTCF